MPYCWFNHLSQEQFLTFLAIFKSQLFFPILYCNCSNVLDMRNLQEQLKKYSVSKILLTFHCIDVRFVSFLSGGFTTMAVVNPLENKLVNRTSVHCTKLNQVVILKF